MGLCWGMVGAGPLQYLLIGTDTQHHQRKTRKWPQSQGWCQQVGGKERIKMDKHMVAQRQEVREKQWRLQRRGGRGQKNSTRKRAARLPHTHTLEEEIASARRVVEEELVNFTEEETSHTEETWVVDESPSPLPPPQPPWQSATITTATTAATPTRPRTRAANPKLHAPRPHAPDA